MLQLAVGCERMCALKNDSKVFGLCHMELPLTEMEKVGEMKAEDLFC